MKGESNMTYQFSIQDGKLNTMMTVMDMHMCCMCMCVCAAQPNKPVIPHCPLS